MNSLIHSQTPIAPRMKFANGKVISSHPLPSVWLLIHDGIHVIKMGPFALFYLTDDVTHLLCFGLLSGVPDYFYRNKISSGGDLSHYSSASLY